MAFPVPHRDEYSETAGFLISGPLRKVLFIPDIDKWEKWESDILQWARKVDLLLIDGTFYSEDELPGRDMSEIPHPFIVETMMKFSDMPPEIRKKISFIHLNHSNPANRPGAERDAIERAGFQVAIQGTRIEI
jgi:pyrroloquinoline quinone biosynthesis protein B